MSGLSHPPIDSSSAWGRSQWYKVTYGAIPAEALFQKIIMKLQVYIIPKIKHLHYSSKAAHTNEQKEIKRIGVYTYGLCVALGGKLVWEKLLFA